MKAVIVGAGPIGCWLAIGLSERDFEVEIYERAPDPQLSSCGHIHHAHNLTFTPREQSLLPAPLQRALHAIGVPVRQRILHLHDGSVVSQPQGSDGESPLLVVPHEALAGLLQQEARRAGVRFFFEHDCVGLNTRRAEVTTLCHGKLSMATADLVIGCDGAGSRVREEMARNGSRMDVIHQHVAYGRMTFALARQPGFLERTASAKGSLDASADLHVWPRDGFYFVAQPNHDGSHSGSLILPLASTFPDAPACEQLTARSAFLAFFERHLPELLPGVEAATNGSLPAGHSALVLGSSTSIHHGRSVLLGDAAHTTLPVYEMSLNCDLEEVRGLLQSLDERPLTSNGVPALLSAFAARRSGLCRAATRRSLAHFEELASPSNDKRVFSAAWPDAALDERQPSGLESLPDDRALPLNLSLPQIAGLMNLTSEFLLSYFRDLQQSVVPPSYVNLAIDVGRYTDGEAACRELKENVVPTTAMPLHALLTELFDKVVTNGTVNSHSGFMAHVPSGGLFQSAVGEFIARSLNRFIGVWVATPGMVQIESNVIKWFCSIMGYDENAFGYLTTSGSLANWMGLHCARKNSGADPNARYTVYVSDQAHYSVGKACMLLGLPYEQVRIIGTHSDYAMNVGKLVAAIQADERAGYTPMSVVATAGTTNTGAIDDLSCIAEVCAQRRIWFHVDACLGGFFRLTQRGRVALSDIARADSIAVDAHKSLFLPHGNSALLVKSRADLRSAFEFVPGAYMPDFQPDPDMVDFCTLGPELSRDTRGLSAWLPIKMHGIHAFEDALNQVLDLAQYLESRLAAIEAIEIVRCHAMHLPIVTFKLRGAKLERAETLNRSLCEQICEAQNAYLTTTELPGHGLVVRACILHPRTTKARVDRLVGDVAKVAHQLRTTI